MLLRPQYARLIIGTIRDDKPTIQARTAGSVSGVPYAEPTWLAAGFKSPYFTESHRRFHKALRTFIDDVVAPDAIKCEENGKRISQDVVEKLCGNGILAMRIGPGAHLKGLKLMGGVITPEEFDCFHELIINQELARTSTRGYVDGILAGGVIGLPPVLNYGSKEIQAKVVPDVLAGRKFIALAISEAFAGSDVAGLQTTATREGDEWVIEGTKKYIFRLSIWIIFVLTSLPVLGGSQTGRSQTTSPSAVALQKATSPFSSPEAKVLKLKRSRRATRAPQAPHMSPSTRCGYRWPTRSARSGKDCRSSCRTSTTSDG